MSDLEIRLLRDFQLHYGGRSLETASEAETKITFFFYLEALMKFLFMSDLEIRRLQGLLAAL